ncbi:MAG TPA: hypothetical protein VGO70_01600 [Arsenicitalea sp.]|jgi:predicted lipoprotein with Yx(FWY)xxD motif|nr:hypothetical protein [Arsenicitalea sp.]
MNLRLITLSAIAITALSASSAFAIDYSGNSATTNQPPPAKAMAQAKSMAPAKPAAKSTGPAGRLITDAKGMTLYTYDKDTAGAVTCTGVCAIAWPPARAPKTAKPTGGLTVIVARGGNVWAYKGHPLYHYAKDRKPGDVTGDGVGGVWHAAMR